LVPKSSGGRALMIGGALAVAASVVAFSRDKEEEKRQRYY
jgi:hypothetical protein